MDVNPKPVKGTGNMVMINKLNSPLNAISISPDNSSIVVGGRDGNKKKKFCQVKNCFLKGSIFEKRFVYLILPYSHLLINIIKKKNYSFKNTLIG